MDSTQLFLAMIIIAYEDQGAEAPDVSEDIMDYLRENRGYMLDYFLRIKDKVKAEELRFY